MTSHVFTISSHIVYCFGLLHYILTVDTLTRTATCFIILILVVRWGAEVEVQGFCLLIK